MKKLFAVLFLLLCSTSMIYAQKTRYGQAHELAKQAKTVNYPIKVHISATHTQYNCIQPEPDISCMNVLYANAILNGKKFELSGTKSLDKHNPLLILPGDYPARLTKDIQANNGVVIYQEYDVLLPDGAIWHCVTTGISE